MTLRLVRRVRLALPKPSPGRPGLAADLGVPTAARDLGMATAEYAIATLAACGFAALLLTLLQSGQVRSLLFGIIRRALSV